jgi:hypothetical protein
MSAFGSKADMTGCIFGPRLLASIGFTGGYYV